MKIISALCLAFAALLASDARAHSELPSQDWCAHGRPVPVGTFELFAEGLVIDRDEGSTCANSSGDDKTPTKECGQFDDDYDRSNRKALRICNGHRRPASGDIGSVIAVVQWPETYLHEDHHRLYKSEHGLRGLCVRCERLRPQPLPGNGVR